MRNMFKRHAMKPQIWLVSLLAAGFVVSAPADDQTKAPSPPAPAPTSAEQTPQPSKQATSTIAPQLAEVTRMAQAGVNENVILTYIDKSPGFTLSANDVVTLHDRGVSLTVITAMLQHPPLTQLAQAPTPPASPAAATLTLSKGANQPVFYPTPARETVPLTDTLIVAYPTAYAFGYPPVSVWGSSYVAAQSYGGCRTFAGVQTYNPACRSYSCDSSYR